MFRTMLKSTIHRATVIQAAPGRVGSPSFAARRAARRSSSDPAPLAGSAEARELVAGRA